MRSNPLEPEYGPKEYSPAKTIDDPMSRRKTPAINAYIVLFILFLLPL
jgi:hypothetical protein